MKIVYYGKPNERLSFDKEVQCTTLNNVKMNQDGYYIFEENENTVWKKDERGYLYPYQKGVIKDFIWKENLNDINPDLIVLNHCDIDQKWIYMELKNRISNKDKVCILAFSFYDDTKNINDWNKQFKKGQGYFYPKYTDVFYTYGVKKENIEWVNYFSDSKQEIENKIINSSILVLPQGAPDLLMKRLKEFKLKGIVKRYKGMIIGCSAGAMVMLDTYHITPDDEYPDFGYYTGLGLVKGFGIEMHYRNSRIQKECIEKVKKEKKIPVYGIYETGGLKVIDNKSIPFGKIDIL